MPAVARSVQDVPHSRIRELAEIAMSMDGVLAPLLRRIQPAHARTTSSRRRHGAMEEGYTFYTENAGLPSLRRRHRRELPPAARRGTGPGPRDRGHGLRRAGAEHGHPLRARSRRRGLVLTPAWPNGSSSVMMANATVRQIPHPLCGGRYRVDFDALEAAVTPRTRLLLYTSPSNPLGWVATEEEQRGLLDFARRHDLWLLADEVYDRLYYAGARLGDPVPSILRIATRDDAVMVVHSFSKSYCMTGWRVGWLVARRDLAAKATQLNEFIISHAPSFAQKAGETALAEGEAGAAAHAGAARRTTATSAWRRSAACRG